jgi:hypothetical protein
MRVSQSVMAASSGTFTINDTTAVTTKRFAAIHVSSSATIAELKVNGESANTVGDYISTPANALTGVHFITPPNGTVFTHIKLSAGQVDLILE